MCSIKKLSGVGDKRAKDFEKKGVYTISDLLYYFPRTHEDRTKFTEIADAVPGDETCIAGEVYSPVREVRIRRSFTIYSMVVFDETGAMNIVWYNNKYVKNAFKTGEKVLFFGKVSIKNGKKEILNPIYEKLEKQRFIGRIVPIYPLSGSLTQKTVQSLMEQAIEYAGNIKECLPREILERYKLPLVSDALKSIHFPTGYTDYERARRRFVFEELLMLQLALFGKRTQSDEKKREPFRITDCAFADKLPFTLTGSQMRVINEIHEDFKKPKAMNRLVQGDVGSGKTAVCAAGVFTAIQNGYQSAIMAPTEILANQHYETFSEFFKDYDIKIALLTKSTKNKKDLYEKIKSGEIDLIIGTNAIIQKDVEYCNLGMVVTDEQHRFGVTQRGMLSEKGENPHTLIMTATPIPRTLSLILYGDLDVSVIDELPPGRKPVSTYAVGEDMRRRVYGFLEKQVTAGSQAYVVCPLVEESDKSDLEDAENIHKTLSRIFPQFSVGLIHGRMKSEEKDKVMCDFVEKRIDILVSTTVIEVGVNVPNSNIMIIENAERFGLSTLHQLRGRVGRGQEKAYCIMFAHGDSEITKKRMDTLCSSNDGFYISEQDLKLRGPGDFFGTRQHGLPEMRVANLFADGKILEAAQKTAKEIAEKKLNLSEEEEQVLLGRVKNVLPDTIVLN
ncbi:MAG: ATP-dependent DNA helicase RecG [Ruminococcaceae bacterium]|nr:ATP-dependent DNA helicase RecG [Oscillospiraceae bacterium]